MIELGELEKAWPEFEKRNVRVVALSLPVSSDDWTDASLTQADFKHLTILLDSQRDFADKLGFVHPHSNPHGGDTLGPATILLDETGKVRWLARPDRHITRLSPSEVLKALDENVLKK